MRRDCFRIRRIYQNMYYLPASCNRYQYLQEVSDKDRPHHKMNSVRKEHNQK